MFICTYIEIYLYECVLFMHMSFLTFQFSQWVDAVMFVFSLENEASFNAVYNFYVKLSHYSHIAELPLILVGTQGELRLSK